MHAQHTKTSYTYDAFGNRIQRKTILLIPRLGKDSIAATIKVFPNPTTEKLNVFIYPLTDSVDTRLVLADLSGRSLLFKKCLTSETELDLSYFSSGTYILQMEQGNKKNIWKIIKTK